MAARGAGAAARDAVDRVSRPPDRHPHGRISLTAFRRGPPRKRLRGWPQRRHRVSLGRRSRRPAAGIGSRSCQQAGVVNCFERRDRCGPRCKGGERNIPIVFVMGGDPVKLGMVASLNRPGGNATGVSFLLNVLAAKRVGVLLRDWCRRPTTIGLLVNPDNPNAEATSRLPRRPRAHSASRPM